MIQAISKMTLVFFVIIVSATQVGRQRATRIVTYMKRCPAATSLCVNLYDDRFQLAKQWGTHATFSDWLPQQVAQVFVEPTADTAHLYIRQHNRPAAVLVEDVYVGTHPSVSPDGQPDCLCHRTPVRVRDADSHNDPARTASADVHCAGTPVESKWAALVCRQPLSVAVHLFPGEQ